MVLMAGLDLPLSAIREQIASALHVIVQLGRLSDGTRKVVNVTEVSGMEGSLVTLQDLFVFKQTGVDPDGKVHGNLITTGIRPSFASRLEAFGVNVEQEVFASRRWA
jgi:pilus assembly protein CpaF